ncbi:WD40-repeat-containing domain protein [Scheffersomyces amazonensis]|uniref:WD40-repeat-containing domain protein n=1 Tax=Scheffersomyces amazonensis TaxID=1078765 RepID=UPI00315DF9A4
MTSEVGFNPVSSINEEEFHALKHYGPVTSLKIHENYILAGNGSILKVFKIEKNEKTRVVYSERVLKRNKIHSIVISSEGKVCISGGRSFAMINFADLISNKQFAVIERAINEWIITTEFLNENTLLILNSHNTIYKIDIINNFKLIDKIHCNEKSILYSGSIRKINENKIIIAAGTVMNGCIIWELNSRTMLHNLTDHEGSIFGVKIDNKGQYIISCSDDRSIKLYDFQSGNLLASGWGHGSRIWNLEFFQDTSNGFKIMSAGEDCTMRIWQYLPNQDILQQLQLWEDCHRGKHIWSADIDDINLKLCVSGGADGKIRLHDLSNRGKLNNYTLNYLSQQANISFKKNEIIKSFVELQSLGLLIIITSGGHIILFDQESHQFKSLELSSDESNKFEGFGLMQSFNDINVVAVSSIHGEILILEFTSFNIPPKKTWINNDILGKNKVTNFMAQCIGDTYYLFIDCPNSKIPFILKTFKYNSQGFQLENTLLLEQPQQTSFTTTDMSIDLKNNWLIVASRYVSLAIYDLNSTERLIPLSKLHKKISAGDSITSISIIESSIPQEIILLTIVRDGIYMYIRINETFDINIIHKNNISRGFIEGGYIDNNNELILYGFKSSSFYIWNETKQIELTNVLCGGANRLWKVIKYNEDQHQMIDYKFLFINKSELNIFTFQGRFIKDNYGLINEGTHGREIRDVTISPELLSDNSRLIMTASEDTTLNLSKLLCDGSIKNIWNLNRHVSGLQKIKFFNNKYIGSSAANEEFFIWKIEMINNNPVIREYSRLQPSNDNPDVRIMDFDSIPYYNGLLIATAYSNSDIKVWYFDINNAKFQLICQGTYSTFCILNITMLQIDNHYFIQIGSTDGYLTIYDISQSIGLSSPVRTISQMIIKQKLHQNALKAIYIKPINSYTFKVFTGGDDNALILGELVYNQSNESLQFNILSFIEDAASSTITSISNYDDNTIIVTSVDQIIRKWIHTNNELQCLAATYTTVADTGCCDTTTFNDQSITVIGGAGLSTWK